MIRFDLQCFLWGLKGSNSFSGKCIAIAWTKQLFRIWDRFWPLQRCTSMPLTRRLRSHSRFSRCPSDCLYQVAFACQHQSCEVSPCYFTRLMLASESNLIKTIGGNCRCHRASVAKDAAWALHSTCKNKSWCGVGEADCISIVIIIDFRWLGIILHTEAFNLQWEMCGTNCPDKYSQFIGGTSWGAAELGDASIQKVSQYLKITIEQNWASSGKDFKAWIGLHASPIEQPPVHPWLLMVTHGVIY